MAEGALADQQQPDWVEGTSLKSGRDVGRSAAKHGGARRAETAGHQQRDTHHLLLDFRSRLFDHAFRIPAMKVLLTGATGFLGQHLGRRLTDSGHEVFPVSRQAGLGFDWSALSLSKGVESTDAVIHLAGENIFGRRWSTKQKQLILESRTLHTEQLAKLLAEKGSGTLISASAVGYYGPRDNEEIDESAPAGRDFLAEVCRQWEAAAKLALVGTQVRNVQVRIGVILGREGGAYKLMKLPFSLGLGGPVGNGRQVFPWIHVHDLARLFVYLLENPECSGAFNGTAPGAVTSAEFARGFGRVLKRPAFLPAPGFAMRLALGEVADVLLTGQRAIPKRAIEAGFAFDYPLLEPALENLVRG